MRWPDGFDPSMSMPAAPFDAAHPAGRVWVSHDGVQWMDLGYVDPDGLVCIQEEAEGAPPGIVEQIDAAVEQLCACGCRRRLDPDGPSAYFHSPSCQRRWNERLTDDPDDVYRRADAALVHVGRDSTRVPLRAPRPEQSADRVEYARRRLAEMQHADGQGRRPQVGPIELAECPDLHGVGYRRPCGRCSRWAIPRVFQLTEEGPLVLRHECRGCGTELPGRVYVADMRQEGRWLWLVLGDELSRAKRRVSVRALERADDRTRFVHGEWARLETRLKQFRRSWSGQRRSALLGMPPVHAEPSALISPGGL